MTTRILINFVSIFKIAKISIQNISAICCAILLANVGLNWVVAAEKTVYRFERDVVPGGKGGNRIEVDVSLIAGSQGKGAGRLSDLRLFTRTGQEVPYLLIEPPQGAKERSAERIMPIQPTRRSSGFEADLGAAMLIDRLRIVGLTAPFLKRVRLEGSGDRTRWIVLVEEQTLFDLPRENLRCTSLEFSPQELRYLRVTWDDSSSARVPRPPGVNVRPVGSATITPTLRVGVAFETREGEPGTSRFRIRLPGSHLPIIAIEVVPVGGNLMRPALITEARLVTNDVRPHILGSTTLRRSEQSGLAASDLRIPISPPQEGEIELAIDDGDNPPLILTEIAAIFAPQPWIYFESTDGEPLVARFGSINLDAPRYDLEVMRSTLSATGVYAHSRWGEQRERFSEEAVEEDGDIFSGGATIRAKAFRVSRHVSTGPSGLTTLRLDLPVLAESPSLADIRLASGDSEQVPYLLESQSEPLVVAIQGPSVPTDAKSCGINPRGNEHWSCYIFTLPAKNLPAARVAVTTSIRVFERRVVVRYRRVDLRRELDMDGHGRDETFVTTLETIWRHSDPDRPAHPLRLDLPSLPVAELLIAIEDGDNRPLPLVSAKLYLPAYRLRFFRQKGAELRLLYGQAGLPAPRYDITLLGPRLLGATAYEASLAPAPANDTPPTSATSFSRLFWATLIIAVIALLVLTTHLLRKPEIKTPE